MKFAVGLVTAAILGVGTSFLLSRSVLLRDSLGQSFARGHLVALVNSTNGIYEADLVDDTTVTDEVAQVNLRLHSQPEVVELADTRREVELLRAQFGSEERFEESLHRGGISVRELRRRVTEELRGRKWLAKQSVAAPTEQECRDFYAANHDRFRQPLRFRAAHIFLAAPDGYPDSVLSAKRTAADEVSQQLANGGDFAQLAATFSEDEATKLRGGDLEWFSAERMPPEFIEQVAKLAIGATSAPIRTHLGFHIVRLLAKRPLDDLTFDAARSEIVTELKNMRHAQTLAAIRKTLTNATYVRSEQ